MAIVSTVLDSLRTLRYLWNLWRVEGFSNPFKGMQSPKDRPMYILANGPSLKELLEKIESDFSPYENAEFFVVNDFVHDRRFELMKPRHYVMSDPLFFVDTIYSERGHRAMDALAQKVNWEMTLFAPMVYKNSKFTEILKNNRNISICYFHSIHYNGNPSWRNWFYSKGLGNGEYGTVALNALYAAIMCGYKTIYFYGIDHTFFSNLAVNSDNVLCFRESHFYESESKMKPMINHYSISDVRPFTMHEFLLEKTRIFLGHNEMNEFASYQKTKVYNCTPESLVDSYPKLKT